MLTLETPRLILRLPVTADIGPLDEMDSDPEVMRAESDADSAGQVRR